MNKTMNMNNKPKKSKQNMRQKIKHITVQRLTTELRRLKLDLEFLQMLRLPYT